MATEERLSATDTAWLRMDRPTNPMTILGVLVLAGPRHGRFDGDRLEALLADRLLAIPRFRQRVVQRGGTPWWADDPLFDIHRHIHRLRLPGRGGKRELERLVSDLASTPLDLERPPWQFTIVEDFEGGAALVSRIHHVIGDGMALLGVLLSLSDEYGAAAGPAAGQPPRRDTAPALPGMGLIADAARLTADLWSRGLRMATNPVETIREGTGVAAELAWLAAMPSDSPTRLKGRLSGNKRAAWTDPILLPEVKAVARVLGCSINDMLLAAVAGALNLYLADKGDPTAGVEVRALVPVNLRPPGPAAELGNRFGVLALELPVGLSNPLARLYEVHRRMEKLKNSFEPQVSFGLVTALGYAPKAVQDRVLELLLSRATAVMTNVPGPQQPLHIAGGRLAQAMFWVPQSGDIGIGVSILSFDGRVQFGVIADTAVLPDPEAVTARIGPEFEQLLYFVLLEPWGEVPPDPALTPLPAAAPVRHPAAPSHRRGAGERPPRKG